MQIHGLRAYEPEGLGATRRVLDDVLDRANPDSYSIMDGEDTVYH
jgi:hypothetical protein